MACTILVWARTGKLSKGTRSELAARNLSQSRFVHRALVCRKFIISIRRFLSILLWSRGSNLIVRFLPPTSFSCTRYDDPNVKKFIDRRTIIGIDNDRRYGSLYNRRPRNLGSRSHATEIINVGRDEPRVII